MRISTFRNIVNRLDHTATDRPSSFLRVHISRFLWPFIFWRSVLLELIFWCNILPELIFWHEYFFRPVARRCILELALTFPASWRAVAVHQFSEASGTDRKQLPAPLSGPNSWLWGIAECGATMWGCSRMWSNYCWGHGVVRDWDTRIEMC